MPALPKPIVQLLAKIENRGAAVALAVLVVLVLLAILWATLQHP
jgi:hypothetical protein